MKIEGCGGIELSQIKLMDSNLFNNFINKYLNPVNIDHGGTGKKTAYEGLKNLFDNSLISKSSIIIETGSSFIEITELPYAHTAPKIIIYGKSVQDGIPTPEHEIVIYNRVENSTVTVKVNDSDVIFNLGEDNFLRGLKTSDENNYTYQDSTGQKWICDTYEYDAFTKKGTYTKRIAKGYIDGNENPQYGSFEKSSVVAENPEFFKLTKANNGLFKFFGFSSTENDIVVNEKVECLCNFFGVDYSDNIKKVGHNEMHIRIDSSQDEDHNGITCLYSGLTSETYKSFFNLHKMIVLAPYKNSIIETFTEENKKISLIEGNNVIEIENKTDFLIQYIRYLLPTEFGGTGVTTIEDARDKYSLYTKDEVDYLIADKSIKVFEQNRNEKGETEEYYKIAFKNSLGDYIIDQTELYKANTAQYGITKLSNDTSSQSVDQAATSKAVFDTYQLASSKCSKVINETDIIIDENSWSGLMEEDGTGNFTVGYRFIATLQVEGMTEQHYPEVVFNASDAVSGYFSPTIKSGQGVVYIYSTQKVKATIKTVIGIL